MIYINNQYIRLNISLEEIAKIEIRTDEKNKLIEELDIEMKDGEYPNVVIACGEKVEYNNIFASIKVLITDEKALIKNEYKIPEYIEKIIVNGYVYENKKEEIERIKEGLKNGNELINAIQKGLIKTIQKENKELVLEILERENINVNVDVYGYTSLILACSNNMESVALKLLEREEININQVNKYGETALILACNNKIETVALKLLEREEININQVNSLGYTALEWACIYKMESVALKQLEKEEIDINQFDKNKYTALIWACKNKMESVALKLLERGGMNPRNGGGCAALNYAIKNKMESVIKRIKELQKK